MPPAGFERAISASERPQTRALGRAATGIGHLRCSTLKRIPWFFQQLVIFRQHLRKQNIYGSPPLKPVLHQSDSYLRYLLSKAHINITIACGFLLTISCHFVFPCAVLPDYLNHPDSASPQHNVNGIYWEAFLYIRFPGGKVVGS